MNEMVNATTSLFPLLTIKASNTLYLNLSILGFSLVAGTNHILPENLDGLTHIVKYLFSNLIFSLVNLNPLFGITVSLLDILPLFFDNKLLKKISELVLQIPRQILELYLIYQIYTFNSTDAYIMIACKFVYFIERSRRIKANTRNDYPIIHAAEHYGIFLLLANMTYTTPEIYQYFVLLFVTIIIFALVIYFFNKYIDSRHMNKIPKWFGNDPILMEVLKDKITKNKNSEKIYNYLTKPMIHHLKFQIVTWAELEKTADSIIKKINPDDVDVVVGIKTGGFFVAKYISFKLNKPFLYINSKLWSGISIKKNLSHVYSFYLGKKFEPVINEIPEVKGKNVLLCDDTSYTGTTMRNVLHTIKEVGQPNDVKTLCLWINGSFVPDFYERIMRVPLLWEWGAEVD